jgi:hypothetical protein
MVKYLTLIILLGLRLVYQSPYIQATTAPFTDPSLVGNAIHVPAHIISFNSHLKNDKVFLEWQVNENDTADQFQVEKSEDGKHFILAAIVFGDDKPETTNYQFYEKVNSLRLFYRVKLINKNQQAAYSHVIKIGSNH